MNEGRCRREGAVAAAAVVVAALALTAATADGDGPRPDTCSVVEWEHGGAAAALSALRDRIGRAGNGTGTATMRADEASDAFLELGMLLEARAKRGETAAGADAVRDAEEAIHAFSRALRRSSGGGAARLGEVLARKAALLIRVGRLGAAVEEADRLLAVAPSADAHWLRGEALLRRRVARRFESFARGDEFAEPLDPVLESFRNALDLDPMHPRALHAMSLLARPELPGRPEGARAMDPSDRGAWRIDARTLGRLMSAPDAALGDAAPADAAYTHFALFNMFAHDEERRGAAWAHLARGNAILAAHRPYAHGREEEHARAIMHAFRPGVLSGLGAGRNATDDLAAPIFVVGLPFSGTSLVEAAIALSPSSPRVLSSVATTSVDGNIGLTPFDISPTVHASLLPLLNDPGELHVDGAKLRGVAEAYLRRCLVESRAAAEAGDADPSGRRRLVDSSPGNILNLGYIAMLFPRAKVIHVARDPMENLVQLHKHVFDAEFFPAANGWSGDQRALARKYRQYAELVKFWRGRLPRGMLYEVAYEDIVLGDGDAAMAGVFEFANLQWGGAARAFLRQQRGVHARNVVVDARRGEHGMSASDRDAHRRAFRELVAALGEDVRHLIPSEHRGDARDVFAEESALYSVTEVANMSSFGEYVGAAMRRNAAGSTRL